MALRMTFLKTDSNADHAVVGKLTLFDGTAEILTVDVFSGGGGFNPIDDGTYRARLDIRGDENTVEANSDGSLKPFYGIQKVCNDVTYDGGKHWNPQDEWGHVRARLNPTSGSDHGDYIHGKLLKKNWTHGCICDRSEKILNHLWNLGKPPKAVELVVSGGAQFNTETLVRKNRPTK